MRLFSVLLGCAALLQPCFAIDEVEAARVLYYYTVYDLDVEVYGQGSGHVATGCKGVVLPDKRCTLDEFVNFIDLGEASTNPKYYDLSSSFSFLPGDINAIVAALMKIDELGDNYVEKIVKGRRTTLGVFDDLAKIVDKNHQRAESRNIGIRRHMTNLQEVLGGLRVYQSAKMEGGLAERMRNYKKDVVWKIVQRESEYRSAKWNKIDWRATVEANPDLRYPSSNLYKDTVSVLKGYDKLDGNMAERSIARRTADTFNGCFKS